MSEGPEQIRPIPPVGNMKDIANVTAWMKTHIKRIPAGYDDLTRPDGTPLTLDEQFDTYVKQTTDVLEFMIERNDPDERFRELETTLMENTKLPSPPPISDPK